MLPFALTIACSSLLLFLVQPVMARAILPRFGGSAGVWVTCMLFFQVVLLFGYGYSYLVTRYLPRKAQAALHAALLLAGLAVLPLALRTAWTPSAGPVLSILGLLAVSVGLPYFLLSTTSPLLQAWYSGSGQARFPYRLFALSNAASLAALLAYPVAIEPLLDLNRQLRWWSLGYAVFTVLAIVAAIRPRATGGAPEWRRYPWGRSLTWIALAACASTLWLAVANHMSQEVAAIPFLWILPLGLYLLSFILCFESSGWYRPSVFAWLLPLSWAAFCWRVAFPGSVGLLWEIPILAAALFVCAMFCHGELAESKPEPAGLTWFYLMVALGGALGAVFVGLIAPNVFTTYLELPIGITGCVLLALWLLYGLSSPRRLARLAVLAALAFVVATRFNAPGQNALRLRNFYGAILVVDTGSGDSAVRLLYNGRTLHGVQFLAPGRSRRPAAYYGPESGAGRVFAGHGAPRRVGIIGLGAGALAAYGRAGDSFRFFEINPAVYRVATREFRFLAESPAQTDVHIVDGRLGIAREPPSSFDVIVLDAFSDDSIPVHLLTREAFDLYFERLRPSGLLAVHITNRYLDLYPIVASLAASLGKRVVAVHSPPDAERQLYAADWAILSGGDDAPASPAPRARLWTDQYSNLFGALR